MKIQILKCTDPRMWYNSLVGQQVHVEREDSDYFWCREIEGYLNIVLKTDATVVSMSLSDLAQK
mgnify:FL=1